MSEVCPKCGLPKELCVCEAIAKEEQQIIISVVKRKFGKQITLIEGIDTKSIALKELAKNLKSKLACGGTIKEGNIELQGNHAQKVKNCLTELGFAPETIKIQIKN
ncbi:stress response translation initiation inhibitor YciH [Candidatus Woesearchaeota archaeon]|nr:stress response translation initiation inhibitor YciH [Candidatus Woesearchaeota archaeon]